MAEVKLYTMIVALVLFAGLIFGGMFWLSPILDGHDISYSTDEKELQSNISQLKNDTRDFLEILGDKKINSSAKDEGGSDYNLGAISAPLKFLETGGALFISATNVLKTALTYLPAWFWWIVLGLITFTFIWKIIEAWLGHLA